MKRNRKTQKKSKREESQMKGTLARHFQVQLGYSSSVQHQSFSSTSSSSRFQNHLESLAQDATPSAADVDDKDLILTQDFFCTPDYITPVNQNSVSGFDCNRENAPCPKSPEKLNTVKSKKRRQDGFLVNPLDPTSRDYQDIVDLANDSFSTDEVQLNKTMGYTTQKTHNYVPPSAVALRCRVMPPPCIKNPYQKDNSEIDIDRFGNQWAKCASMVLIFMLFPGTSVSFFALLLLRQMLPQKSGVDGLSRYYTDFHEMEQIGAGNFSHVFKVLKRIDGCFYAVKHSKRQLHHDSEKRKALLEVQALAALGSHENIVGYYSSWFENEQLYIHMELCDHSLSDNKASQFSAEGEVLNALHQIAKALQFIHEKGIAHLDVKPDNIYVKNGVYKLGDFGRATLLDKSLPIEEGDARYMPQEILNEDYDHLDKVDIFSLGATMYELIKGSPLPESGPQFLNLRDGKLPLLPGHSLQFQNLLKVMVDPDPVQRPSAKELVENPIFYKIQKHRKTYMKP